MDRARRHVEEVAGLHLVDMLQLLAVGHHDRTLEDVHGGLAVDVPMRRRVHPGGNLLASHEDLFRAGEIARDAELNRHPGTVTRPLGVLPVGHDDHAVERAIGFNLLI